MSESTFFRYFPTKEAVVVWDDFDPHIIEVFRAQPAGAGPLRALRTAIHQVLSELSPHEQSELRERMTLMMSAPPLRAALLDQIDGPFRLIAEVVAERSGRRADDPAVRTLVGAVIGAGLSVSFAVVEDPDVDVVALVDEALAHLEAGLTL